MSIDPESIGKKFPAYSGTLPMTGGHPTAQACYKARTRGSLSTKGREDQQPTDHGQDHEARLLLRVKPMGRTEVLCRMLVARVRLIYGALELDLEWAAAIRAT